MSRADRVAALIRSEISTILQKEVSDPRIGFVSITEVELGPDLQLAKVDLLNHGQLDHLRALEALEAGEPENSSNRNAAAPPGSRSSPLELIVI